MNPEHLKAVLAGADAIREWRALHPRVRLDLSGADLRDAHLSGANLSFGNLFGAVLNRADLSRADLSGADLSDATILDAAFRDADLSDADLSGAFLVGADLSGAFLRNANLSGANLSDANLSGATIGWTVLDASMSEARGLESVRHVDASYYASALLATPGIPDVFLRGIGVPQPVMDLLPLLRNELFYRYSTFISYSRKDDTFAERLYNSLQGEGVRVWKDTHEIRPGEKIRKAVFEQIQLRDKLIVLLSKASLASDWVESEVEHALERERREPGTTVLFPVALDRTWETTDVAWAAELRTRLIFDFKGWKTRSRYDAAVKQILDHLRPRPSP